MGFYNSAVLQNTPTPAPPPHSGVGGTACVFPKSPVKGYFSCDKVRPENCKKGGYLTFTRRFLLKRGWFFFLSLFGRMRNLKGGYKIKYRGYIEQFFGFRGVSKAGKACEKPAKGGFRNCVSPEIGGCFQREGTSICVP